MGTCPREQHRVDFETTCEIKRGRRKSIFTYFRRKTNFKNSCSSTRKPKSQPPPENRSSTYFQTPSSSVSEKLHGIGNYKSQNQETNITGRSICYSVLKYPLKPGKTSHCRPSWHSQDQRHIFKHLPQPYIKKLHGIGNYTSQNQKTNITRRSICYSVLKYPHRTGKTSGNRPCSHTHRHTSWNSISINLILSIGDANPAR